MCWASPYSEPEPQEGSMPAKVENEDARASTPVDYFRESGLSTRIVTIERQGNIYVMHPKQESIRAVQDILDKRDALNPQDVGGIHYTRRQLGCSLQGLPGAHPESDVRNVAKRPGQTLA